MASLLCRCNHHHHLTLVADHLTNKKYRCAANSSGALARNTYHECKFRHELIFEEMKDILVFCHDYQNNVPCSKSVCTYLHASSDEEALFYAIGAMPRVLVERLAAVSPIFRNDIYGASALPPRPPPLGAPPSGATAPPLATPLSLPVTPAPC